MFPSHSFTLPREFPLLSLKTNRHALFGERRGAHRHDCCELTLLLHGVTTYRAGSASYLLHPGEVILIGPGEPHEWVEHGEGPAEKRVVLFDPGILRPERPVLGGHVRESEEVIALIDRIARESEARAAGYQTIIRSALGRIVEILETEGMHLRDPVREARDFIRRAFRRRNTLNDIAHAAGCSPGYLSGRFPQEVGSTVKRYVNNHRLTYAAQLLQESDLPVAEVCERAGFGSLSSFERAFKRRFATVPREYRRPGADR